MIEPEMAFCDLDGNRALAEAFLKYVIAYVLDHCAADLEFFAKLTDRAGAGDARARGVEALSEHVTYTEAVALLEQSGRNWEFPVHWGVDLQSEHERYLTEEVFKKPVIVHRSSSAIKAFFLRLNEDGKTVARDGRARAAHRRNHRRQPAAEERHTASCSKRSGAKEI